MYTGTVALVDKVMIRIARVVRDRVVRVRGRAKTGHLRDHSIAAATPSGKGLHEGVGVRVRVE